MSEAADLRACRASMRGGSKSFFAAGLLLPRRVLEPATALYAYCRQADDAIDLCADKQEALAIQRARLAQIYAGQPVDDPADRAFAAIAARFALPRALPEALLEGFAWDAEFRRYEDLDALLGYAARVAGTVGAMMAVLMGVREADALARACDLGMAMQLTNIARDVGEDAREGRLYLPLVWLREEGIDPEQFLAAPRFTPALGRVIARLLDEADALYARGVPGIARLPMRCRPAIRAAGLIYREIGRSLAFAGGNSVDARACVPARRKLALAARSLPALLPARGAALGLPVLAAAEALVLAGAQAAPAVTGTRRDLTGRLLWVAELFARLEEEAA